VMRELRQRHPLLPWGVGTWGMLLLALYVSGGIAKARLNSPDIDRAVQSREEIGAQVNHSSRTIFLSGDYGVPLEYHGLLSGSPWPLASDLEWERLAGVPSLNAQERFRVWFAGRAPEYFIVEDIREFEQQPDLKRFLTGRFPVVARTRDYVIFRLQEG
jgi:hypothetical protein